METTADVPSELRRSAARSLASGDVLSTLRLLGAFQGPHAWALRGIAYAQMGELSEAKASLGRAASAFAALGAAAEHARALAALSEVCLALRELGEARAGLSQAAAILTKVGDHANAAWARLVAARAALLEGRIDEVEPTLAAVEPFAGDESTLLGAVLLLARSETNARAGRGREARRLAEQAVTAAQRVGHPRLIEETTRFLRAQDAEVARVVRRGQELAVNLASVETLLSETEGRIVVDCLRRRVSDGGVVRADLARRPVLFAMIEALARAHPEPVTSVDLARAAFGARTVNESHHRRLRVEMGRLRAATASIGLIKALGNAYRWELGAEVEVAILTPLTPGDAGAIRALLLDGAAWSTASIAAAVGKSQRTVQRALAELTSSREVEAVGSGPARRYTRSREALAIASQMLLLGLSLPE